MMRIFQRDSKSIQKEGTAGGSIRTFAIALYDFKRRFARSGRVESGQNRLQGNSTRLFAVGGSVKSNENLLTRRDLTVSLSLV